LTSASTEDGLTPLAVDLAPARLGTWSDRLIAALVDAGVLLLVGLVVGLAAGRYLPPVGASRLVGWALATLYVGLGSSRWSGGQTVGMLLCDLVLVDSDSRLLSPARSLIRAAVLTGPFCLSAIYLGPQLPAGPLLTWSIFLLSFGILPASIFLFLVGVRRRQFFHDVLVDSFVGCRGAHAEVREIAQGHQPLDPHLRRWLEQWPAPLAANDHDERGAGRASQLSWGRTAAPL